jgi:hypothetical protein
VEKEMKSGLRLPEASARSDWASRRAVCIKLGIAGLFPLEAARMQKIHNIQMRCRQWGWRRALHWELMHALATLGVRVHYVMVGADLREIVGEEEPESSRNYQTRVVQATELEPFIDRVPDLDREFLQTAERRGDVCTANFYNGELVGYSFSSFGRARVTAQLDALVPAGFRYGYKSWTHPDHRRSNLSRMRGYVRRRTRAPDHAERSISYIETHNYASLLHSYRHPSMRSLRMGFCGWITVFGRQIPFNSRRARWIGFEFIRKQDSGARQYV